jgi:glycosyltransferase involved in cell wall biosynthesis
MASSVGAQPQVVVIQTTIPDYRTRFFTALSERLGSRLVLLSGDEDWYRDVKHAGGVPHVHTRNVFLVRRQLLWQAGALRPLLGTDIAVIGLNPRILTSWVALILRRLRRRRTVLWGHAWPRQGIASPKDRVRNVMRGLADTLIVYTETEAMDLRRRSPRLEVVAAQNALYSQSELQPIGDAPATDFICVGRLNPAKKPLLLFDAFRLAESELPPDIRLVFVGDGPLRERLEENARSAGVDDRVLFLGHISSLDELRDIYARAVASISPGYAGLSLLQSLGFGIPMLVARDEPHAPEIEAAIDGQNVIFFGSDSAAELASSLVAIARDRQQWRSRRSLIAEPIRNRYSIESMVDSFVTALGIDQSSSLGDETSAEHRAPGESATKRTVL